MIYFISLLCLCLFIDVIYVMYLYNKTSNFIYQKDYEAKNLDRGYLVIQKNKIARNQQPFKKDTKFDALKRKLGGA